MVDRVMPKDFSLWLHKRTGEPKSSFTPKTLTVNGESRFLGCFHCIPGSVDFDFYRCVKPSMKFGGKYDLPKHWLENYLDPRYSFRVIHVLEFDLRTIREYLVLPETFVQEGELVINKAGSFYALSTDQMELVHEEPRKTPKRLEPFIQTAEMFDEGDDDANS